MGYFHQRCPEGRTVKINRLKELNIASRNKLERACFREVYFMSENQRRYGTAAVKIVLISIVIGIAVYTVICFFEAVLINCKLIPYDMKSIYSKVGFTAAIIISCMYSAKRGRGEAFMKSVSTAVLMFAFSILYSASYSEREWDTTGATICLLICCLGCTLAIMEKKKSGKLHKSRRRRNR